MSDASTLVAMTHLCRDDKLVAAAALLEPPPDDAFAVTRPLWNRRDWVHLRRVQEVPAPACRGERRSATERQYHFMLAGHSPGGERHGQQRGHYCTAHGRVLQ